AGPDRRRRACGLLRARCGGALVSLMGVGAGSQRTSGRGAVRGRRRAAPRRGPSGCAVTRAGAARRAGGRSQSLDVRGLRALGALRDVERDALVLLERAVAARLDLAVVRE